MARVKAFDSDGLRICLPTLRWRALRAGAITGCVGLKLSLRYLWSSSSLRAVLAEGEEDGCKRTNSRGIYVVIIIAKPSSAVDHSCGVAFGNAIAAEDVRGTTVVPGRR